MDYQKAFDTIEKKTIMAALNYFNICAQFIKCIETIQQNTQSAIKMEGGCQIGSQPAETEGMAVVLVLY